MITKAIDWVREAHSSVPECRSRWRMIVIVLVLFLVAGTLLFGTWPHYAGTSVCRTCGIRRDYFTWDMRLVPATIYQFRSDHPTAVSLALPASRQGAHEWTSPVILPESGTENGETSPNLLFAVEAPRVANFVYDLAREGKPDALAKWKRLVLDPQYSTVIAPSLRFLRFPEGGIPDRAAFRAWWQGAEFPLWNRLRELTEPD